MRRQPIYLHFRILSVEYYLRLLPQNKRKENFIKKQKGILRNDRECYQKADIFRGFFFWFLVIYGCVVYLFVFHNFHVNNVAVVQLLSFVDFTFVPIPCSYHNANKVLPKWTTALRLTDHCSFCSKRLSNFSNKILCENAIVFLLFISMVLWEFSQLSCNEEQCSRKIVALAERIPVATWKTM